MRHLKTLPLMAVVALSSMVTSCVEEVKTQQQKSYKTLIVSTNDNTISNRYSTSIRGIEYVDIRPQVSGVITKILINEGATIQRGETLFIIDQVPYQAALDVATANVKSAEAAVATAKLNTESGKELFAEQVISNNELQITLNTLASAEANLALAIAQEQSARNDLSYTVIKSPVDGVAGMIPYRVGALVSSSISDPLVNVANNDKMYAYFSLSESQILSLTRESGSTEALMEDMSKIQLILNDGVLYDEIGYVDAISGTIDQSTGAVSLRAVFENPDKMLRDGGNGSVVITTQLEDVIVIPKVATFELQNKIFAYKVIDGAATSVEIRVYPLDNGNDYVVESGLNVGDLIIAEGAGLIREGTIVTNK